jgi:hypothetical protein
MALARLRAENCASLASACSRVEAEAEAEAVGVRLRAYPAGLLPGR